MAQALSPTALSSMTAPSSHRRKSAYLTRKTSAPYEPLSTHWETALSKQLTTTLCGPSLSVRSNSVTAEFTARDRKSTRLNSSHGYISYAVFCLKKKKATKITANCSQRDNPRFISTTIFHSSCDPLLKWRDACTLYHVIYVLIMSGSVSVVHTVS